MTGIKAEDLDPETREKIGLSKKPARESVKKKVLVLGRVIRDLKGLDLTECDWVLYQARLLCRGKEVDPQPLSPAWVIHVVEQHYELPAGSLKYRGRTEEVARARWLVMYLLWMTQSYALREIGGFLGKRSPATVSYGVHQVITLLNKDEKLRAALAEIQEKLDV